MPSIVARLERVSTRRLVALALFPAFAAASCDASESPPFVGYISRSQYWEYHDEVAEPLCPDLLPLLDRHAEVVGGLVGLGPDPHHPFRYYRFHDLEAVAKACGVVAGGCVDRTGKWVYASTYFQPHEQAHAYVTRAWGGSSVPLLEEGVAVALSCSPLYALDPTRRPLEALGSPAWRDLFQGDKPMGEGSYPAMGMWITSLVRRYGWQSVAELYRRVPPGSLPNDLEREFARVFPLSLDQAWLDALGAPGVPPCSRDWLCGAPPLGVGEDMPYCNGELYRTLSISTEAGFVLSMGGAVPGCSLHPSYGLCYGGIGLVSCRDGQWPWYAIRARQPTVRWVLVPPGQYSIVTNLVEQGMADDYIEQSPLNLKLESYLPSGFVGDTCESAGMMELDPERETYLDLLGEVPPGWVRLRGGGRRYAVSMRSLDWNGRGTAGAPSICESCDPAASCQPLPFNWWTYVTIGNAAVLRVFPGTASGGSPPGGSGSFHAMPPDDAGT